MINVIFVLLIIAWMKLIGVHVSSQPDISAAPAEAHSLGARAFACDLFDATDFKRPPLDDAVADRFIAECLRYGYGPDSILPHSSFMINFGNPDKRKNAMSRKIFIDEMRRCRRLGITMLNFHPGAHLKSIEPSECLTLIADSINRCLEVTDGVKVVIENTAGQGTALGYTFEQLAAIIDKVEDKSRVGVCIDSCHAFAAGYDMATPEGYDAVWADFDAAVGFGYLSAMHLNDALRPLGSKIDRHAPMGRGYIGEAFFRQLMADPRFDGMPLILETPEPELWRDEIAALYAMIPQ